MSYSGQLHIELTVDDIQIKNVQIALRRPDLTEKLLLGQSADSAISRVEQLFVVCKQAQKTAAILALSDSVTGSKNIIAKQQKNVQLENIEQLFWRLIFDFTKALDLPLEIKPFIALRLAIKKLTSQSELNAKAKNQALAEIHHYAQQMFTMLCEVSAEQFYHFSAQELDTWLASSACISVRFLQAFSDGTDNNSDLEFIPVEPSQMQLIAIASAMLANKHFCQQPTWGQRCAQTGSLAAMLHHPLFLLLNGQGTKGRLIARLLDLAQHILELTTNSPRTRCGVISYNNHQLSWVQSARGLLLHLANIQQGKICQYSICAPTEWNFHPEGVLTQWLTNLPVHSAQSAITQATLAILTLDPCIEFTVGAQHA